MLPSVTESLDNRVRPRPRSRNIGAMVLVAAAVLAPTVAMASVDAVCGGVSALGTPASAILVALIGLAGSALLGGVPRSSAVAPALAAGSAVLILAGAAGSWVWLAQAPCVDSVLDAPAALLVVQAGAAIAVIVTSCWLLYARDEFEPWGGVGGVITSAAAAVTTVLMVAGFAVLIAVPAGFGAMALTITIALPWAVIVGATGWLRRSPALAMVASVGLQAVWLLSVYG